MDILVILIPLMLFLGLCGLAAFFWCLNSGQFEDMDGAAQRILLEDDEVEVADPYRHRKAEKSK